MRETGDLEALFVAERVVLASGESLRVWQKRLGQGGFGSVDKVSVPIVGLTVAVKTFKAVSFLNRSKLPARYLFCYERSRRRVFRASFLLLFKKLRAAVKCGLFILL